MAFIKGDAYFTTRLRLKTMTPWLNQGLSCSIEFALNTLKASTQIINDKILISK